MTEYKTFDDFVRDVIKVEPSKLTHLSPEEQKKEKVLIPIDSLISTWNEMVELQVQIEKMKSWFMKYRICEMCQSEDCDGNTEEPCKKLWERKSLAIKGVSMTETVISKELEKKLTQEYGRLSFRDKLMLVYAVSEATQELKAQIEKMKEDVRKEQSYWNSGEMQYGLFQKLLDKWE